MTLQRCVCCEQSQYLTCAHGARMFPERPAGAIPAFVQAGEISKLRIHSLVAIFLCPHSLAIHLLTREWGQGNEEFSSEWMDYCKLLYRHADGQTFGKSRILFVSGALGEYVVNLGRYRHYKGKEYIVLGVAKHSETLEEMVLYRQDYGDGGLWVRPKDMFLKSVEIQGQLTPRFQFLGTE